jgi:hypothetical protein
MTTESIDTSDWAIMVNPLDEMQRLELGDLVPKRTFDTNVQRHQRARATGAHAGEPHVGRIAIDTDELDIPTVRLEKRPNAPENRFDLLLRDHENSPCCLALEPDVTEESTGYASAGKPEG